MVYEDPHLTDEDLLLAADSELSSRRKSEVRAHLASCWSCRTRMAELEATIADFVHLYRGDSDSRISGSEGPTALLKATLAQHAGSPDGERWTKIVPTLLQSHRMIALCTGLLCVAIIVVLISIRRTALSAGTGLRVAPIASGSVPDAYLTPGATRPISQREVCEAGEPTVQEAPVALQRAVFREYGIAHPKARAYEVDYLITPELGGASDIRNLWPQPYFTTVWNAHVKDALEERLRLMVCQGGLDLATAQHDLSRDWIAAYKKYFQTDRPLIFSSPSAKKLPE